MKHPTAGEFMAFGLGVLSAGIGSSLVWGRLHRRTLEAGPRSPVSGMRSVGQWNIAPGETLGRDGARDWVTEGSMESFPASDPPAY
ncbi:MAG: hypothetical protein WBV82_11785 [Myxococcaceae bacterium]